MPRGRSRSREGRRRVREHSPLDTHRNRAPPGAFLPPLQRRRVVRDDGHGGAASVSASESVVSSRRSDYPVDVRFPVSRAASDCASSVTSDVSLAPPVEWVGNAANAAVMQVDAARACESSPSAYPIAQQQYPPQTWLSPPMVIQQGDAPGTCPPASMPVVAPPPPPPPQPAPSVPLPFDAAGMLPVQPNVGTPVLVSAKVPGVLSKASGPPLALSQSHTPSPAAAVAAIVARHTADSAVAPGDPGAELTLSQAESTLLDETSMYQLLVQDQMISPMSHFWQLPSPELIKFSAGRARWLQVQVSSWQRVILTDLQRCVQYMLSLLPADFRNSDQQRLWQLQPSVMLSFCRAMVAVNLPYQSMFQTPARVWACGDRVVWEYSSDKFPGPLTAPTTASTGFYRWYHCGADVTLIGVFTCGRLLRTCAETVNMSAAETPYAFFGRAGYEGQARDEAKKAAELVMHPKNRTGVLVSGRIVTCHHKMTSSSTYWETLACREHELVKSASSDKRWAIRESSARIDRFYLVCVRPASEAQIPSWDAIQAPEQQHMLRSFMSNMPVEDWS